jgi:cytosine/adenosine deaminase-related metal-dependent hydrolase
MRMLINARNRSVAVDGDRIVAEGGKFDVVIDCRDADVRPGLINAHDHLHRNHYGRLGAGPYPNAYRWAEDIQVRFRRRIAQRRRIPRRAALLAGAWKNLFAGVTTVVHHDPWERDFDQGFPIRVARIACADSLGLGGELSARDGEPFCLHVAEGVDGVAAGELSELDDRDLLGRWLVAVHGVGIESRDVERFRSSGAALVWCPTSNYFLFNRTASHELLGGGSDVLLGSDSRLTGGGDLLDEIQAARATGVLDDDRIERSIGSTAARRLGLPEPSLELGARADLILLKKAVMHARSEDVSLVVVDGVPRVADPDLARELGPTAESGSRMQLGQVERWINGQRRSG